MFLAFVLVVHNAAPRRPFREGKSVKQIFVFLSEPLIAVLVPQIVFLQSQLVPVEWTQYSLKATGYLRKDVPDCY